jgi:glycosyltransferase involved in cell wall biosynthesis
MGNVTDEELLHCYQRSSIVCIPSLQEGFGIIALEAQACGTLVVSTRTGGLPDAVEDKRYLVLPGDVNELSEALARALNDRSSEKAWRRRHEFIEKNFSYRKVGLQLEDVYKRALSNKSTKQEMGVHDGYKQDIH